MVKNCKNCKHAYYVYGCEFACKYYDIGECNESNLNYFELKVPLDLQHMRKRRRCSIATDIRGSEEVIPCKKYLIAYTSPYNDRVLTETIKATNQKEAIHDFGLRNANCDIIAITIMEE